MANRHTRTSTQLKVDHHRLRVVPNEERLAARQRGLLRGLAGEVGHRGERCAPLPVGEEQRDLTVPGKGEDEVPEVADDARGYPTRGGTPAA
jgi:hypothetical protein